MGLDNGFNVLAENTTDKENGVRFAVLNHEVGKTITDNVKTVISGCKIELTEPKVQNPVLSKMLVNYIDRYEL